MEKDKGEDAKAEQIKDEATPASHKRQKKLEAKRQQDGMQAGKERPMTPEDGKQDAPDAEIGSKTPETKETLKDADAPRPEDEARKKKAKKTKRAKARNAAAAKAGRAAQDQPEESKDANEASAVSQDAPNPGQQGEAKSTEYPGRVEQVRGNSTSAEQSEPLPAKEHHGNTRSVKSRRQSQASLSDKRTSVDAVEDAGEGIAQASEINKLMGMMDSDDDLEEDALGWRHVKQELEDGGNEEDWTWEDYDWDSGEANDWNENQGWQADWQGGSWTSAEDSRRESFKWFRV